jgi:hypothetical protein
MLLSGLIALCISFQASPAWVFEIDLWPGEGRPLFEAVSRQLQLHEFPSMSSKVVRTLTVAPRHQLVFDDTRYRTIKPGRFRVLVSGALGGRNLGSISKLSRSDYYSGRFPSASVPAKAGDTIEYLQYRAEGTCFIRIAFEIIDAALCPNQQPAQFRLDVEPITEWWIHITMEGTPAGWLLVSNATVKVVDRRW